MKIRALTTEGAPLKKAPKLGALSRKEVKNELDNF